ncbi:MAG: helix-turn-helix domain-containing protein [Haloechinothrix sp.]
MYESWSSVADALRARIAELDLTQADLADRSGVSLTTIRELVQNRNPRYRQPRTLTALSEALEWPPERLHDVLSGALFGQASPPEYREEPDATLRAMRVQLEELRGRIDSIERIDAIITEMRGLRERMSHRLSSLDA